MELQLGLALPTHHMNPMFERFDFDLNKNGLEPNDQCCLGNNKRSFAEAFENEARVRKGTLPLLSWNRQPNEEDNGKEKKTNCKSGTKIEVEENHVVGWPPIKSWRKKQFHYHQGGVIVKDRTVERRNRSSNSAYVKVKMEGVPIGRKIDLRLYHSYHTLINTLISMFAKHQKSGENSVRYTLTYQDKEGDWLLAGDVPWQSFIESVYRLEILRNAG